jgi:Glycerophosphoryl diester phosphodiesterase family
MDGKETFAGCRPAVGRLEGETGAVRLLRVCCALLLAVAAAITVVGLSARSANSQEVQQVVPLERAHAHNDYEHERPLYDALDQGFKSVEADIWLIDGELVVAHDDPRLPTSAPAKGTLESLYLEPLRREIKANGGSVYQGDPDYFTLLIDIKSEDVATYRALHEQLREYQSILTSFGPGGVKDGAVTAIVSGNRPRAYMEAQRVRYAAYDGRLSDLGTSTDQTFVPLISDNWTNNFTWQGVGPMPEPERQKLREIVAEAHANGQRVRFWETPETPGAREAVWQELVAAGVDYINTDNLAELESFLRANDPMPTEPYVYWNN